MLRRSLNRLSRTAGTIHCVTSHYTRLTVWSSKAIYQKCNVTVWDEQVELFELAMSTYGSVDVVVRTFDWSIIHNVYAW